MLASLTDLIAECGETKATKLTGTKKSLWRWDEMHQKSVHDVKKAVRHEIMMAYTDYSKPFSIYTDASTRQLGAVRAQNNRPFNFLVIN